MRTLRRAAGEPPVRGDQAHPLEGRARATQSLKLKVRRTGSARCGSQCRFPRGGRLRGPGARDISPRASE